MEERVPIEPTIVGAAWRHRFLLLGILVVALAAGYAYALRGTQTYVADATLVVRDPKDVQVFGNAAFRSDPQRYAADQVEILESLIVAERAAALMEPTVDYSPEDVLDRRSVTGDTESGAITIEFAADTPEVAKLGADSIAEAYQQVQTDRARESTAPAVERLDDAIAELDTRIDTIRLRMAEVLTAAGSIDALSSAQRAEYDSLIAELQSTMTERSEFARRRTQIEVDSALTGVGIGAFSPALLPGPTESGPVRPMAIAGVLGLMVGVSVAYLRALSRRRFEARHEPEAVLTAPLLADVPDFGKERLKSPLPVAHAAASASAESFRFVAAALDVGAVAADGRSLAVVSCLAAEGKSTIVANTALALAQQGRRVLVVDGDVANQGLSRMLLGEEPSGPGLVDLVTGDAANAIRTVRQPNGVTFWLLPAGQPKGPPTEVFRGVERKGVIAKLERQFDFVLIDSPPMLQVAYATALLTASAAVIVVVPHGSSIAELEELADRLRLVGAPVAGYVYNRAPLRPEVSTTVGSIAAHRRASAAAAAPPGNGNGARSGRRASQSRQLQ